MKAIKHIIEFIYQSSIFNRQSTIAPQSSIGNRQSSILLALLFSLPAIALADPYYVTPDRDAGKGRVLYSASFSINGLAASVGDEVAAFDGSGVCRGRFTVSEPGKYGFMPVHAASGEVISFRVVSKAAKREYTVTGTYTMDGATGQFDSMQFALVTGGELDTDSDGMCDYWEWFYSVHGFNPGAWNNPDNDADDDGLTDIQEYIADTGPATADSDGDGFSDGVEVYSGSDPLDDGELPALFRINYQPDGSQNLDGFLKDGGKSYSPRGYGW